MPHPERAELATASLSRKEGVGHGLMRALSRIQPDSQFIYATQSAYLWDAALSHQRFFLVPPGDPRERTWAGPEASRSKV